jgi:DNA-binding NtrC family response regulator
VAPEVLELLVDWSWEGNVRELENTLRRAVVLCGGTRVELEDLPEHLHRRPVEGGRPLRELEREAAERVARRALVQALRTTRGDVRAAAELLRTPTKTVYHKLKLLGISPRRYRERS